MSEMTGPDDNSLEHQVLGIRDLDSPIYRVFKLWHFEEALRARQLMLLPPRTWDDPHESLLERSAIDRQGNDIPIPLARAYAQCWSATGDSDTLLRAYSFVVNDQLTGRNIYPGAEGVLVKSTARKLLNASILSSRSHACGPSCFIGKVQYRTETEIRRWIGNALRSHRYEAFNDLRLRAESLLIKRRAFRHEDEVRLLWVEPNSIDEHRDLFRGRWCRSPIPQKCSTRLPLIRASKSIDVEERKGMLTRLGYKGSIGQWSQYQRVALGIELPENILFPDQADSEPEM